MDELEREVRGLRGDKRMTELAVSSAQANMLAELRGDMGEDMKAVLNGERTVEISAVKRKKFKIVSWFKRLLRKF